MTETILFAVAFVIAILGAVIMLTSRNAVHSALGLVVTMGALAFLFLMLDAPFLAMIQITVYAGAIMVLFIFVIMLLGAEKLDLHEPFRWLPSVGLTLAVSLLLAIGWPILTANVNLQDPPPPAPRVRVVHAAPDVSPVTIALNDKVVVSGLAFQSISDFAEVSAGDYTVSVTPEGGSPITAALSFVAGTVQTIIAYGEGDQPSFAVVNDDLSTITEARNSRIMVFNGYMPDTSVSLVNFGSEFDENDTRTYANDIPYGAASDAFYVLEGDFDITFVPGAGATDVNPGIDNVLYRDREFVIERDQAQLIVLSAERQFDGSLRAEAIHFEVEARPSFGGPRAIGTLLFIDYMLPMQLLAVLLLAAMVGAIILTHRHVSPVRQRTNARRRVARPLTNVIASQVGHEVVEDAPQLPAKTEERS
jgi:NADH:ubiquinone oxidoreductase subunit 6 (subunit J)